MGTHLRILLAEDHATVRQGLRLLIDSQPDMQVVGEAGDGKGAVAKAQTLRPDVVLMDLSMPELNGLKATEALAECCPGVKVLALTRYADEGYLRQLLRAGAAGYMLKQSPASELMHAIRAVASGGKYLDPAIAGKVMDAYGMNRAAPRGDAAGRLTGRETEVLRLIASGYSNKEVAAELDLSVKTVETHKANAMDKLGMQSRIDIVRFALLQGWLHEI